MNFCQDIPVILHIQKISIVIGSVLKITGLQLAVNDVRIT